MSFLAPLFLLGATAIALPIVFHLIRRSSRERVPFSSLMFLQPTPPRVTRRSKIENVFLLILRCLVLGLLAFAFARPFFSKPVAPDSTGQGGRKLLVLIDTSASLRRNGLWTDAKARAEEVMKRAGPADQVACYTFDRDIRPLLTFDQWLSLPAGDRAALAAQRLADIHPGWAGTRLGNALLNACETFESKAKDEAAAKEIVLITDLQEGSRLEGLQGFEWPRGIHVSVETLRSGRTSNAGLQLASEADTAKKPTSEDSTRLRVMNSSDSKREQFQLGWERAGQPGFVGPTIDAYIPPGQSRVLYLPRPPGEAGLNKVALTGDDDEFDDSIYLVPPRTERTQILFLGNDIETNSTQSLFYLKRAFQETRKLAVDVVGRTPQTVPAERDLADSSLIIVNDALPEETVRALRTALESGKSVLVSVSQVGITPTLSQLLGGETLAAEEAAVNSYAMLGQIDFEHPLFAPFADPRYSDFTKIHFWKHRRLGVDKVTNARVLARFDDGSPALTEVPVGRGRVWVLAAGWHPEDSQLALSSKFVPLLYAMLEQSGGIQEQRTVYTIGDLVSPPRTSEAVTVRKPNASEVTLAPGEKFTGTDEPGIYTFVSVQPPVSFAVNVPPEESRTAPLPLDEFERLGVPLSKPAVQTTRAAEQRREHLQAAQLESRQKLWRWLIVAALVVLVVETWLAGRLTRRTAPAT